MEKTTSITHNSIGSLIYGGEAVLKPNIQMAFEVTDTLNYTKIKGK